jgi:hypothetical protein
LKIEFPKSEETNMKPIIEYPLILICALFLFAGCATSVSIGTIPAWEYKTVKLNPRASDFQQRLNEVAKDRWKLYYILPLESLPAGETLSAGASGDSEFIFERQK